jgi:hypothetical protein
MARQVHVIDGVSDDMTIAQGLLGRPNIPRRSYSFSNDPPNFQFLDGSNYSTLRQDSSDAKKQRRVLQSSNTWTTSSGEVLSDRVEIDDREAFIHEYNRLAKKVWDWFQSSRVKANSVA